jgi:hypothetical protein
MGLMRTVATFVCVVVLGGCADVSRTGPVLSDSTSQAVLPAHVPLAAKPADSDCGVYEEPRLSPKGGHMIIPTVPSTGNFGGLFQYAPLSAELHLDSLFYSCPDNAYNVPVPEGYAADWFGLWQVCDGECPFSFGDAKVKMYVKSTTWAKKVPYFLYVYATPSGVLLESYSIGSADSKKGRIEFASPFANGLAWPTDDSISLEIVHAL